MPPPPGWPTAAQLKRKDQLLRPVQATSKLAALTEWQQLLQHQLSRDVRREQAAKQARQRVVERQKAARVQLLPPKPIRDTAPLPGKHAMLVALQLAAAEALCVREVCQRCGGSGDAEHMLFCCDCGEAVHYFCEGLAHPPLGELPRLRAAMWRCGNCASFCVVCGDGDCSRRESSGRRRRARESERKRVQYCMGCGQGFHLGCLQPPVEGQALYDLERGLPFFCGRCVSCADCPSSPPEQPWRSWSTSQSRCFSCDMQARDSCSVCMLPWGPGASLVQCDGCQGWVHTRCQRLGAASSALGGDGAADGGEPVFLCSNWCSQRMRGAEDAAASVLPMLAQLQLSAPGARAAAAAARPPFGLSYRASCTALQHVGFGGPSLWCPPASPEPDGGVRPTWGAAGSGAGVASSARSGPWDAQDPRKCELCHGCGDSPLCGRPVPAGCSGNATMWVHMECAVWSSEVVEGSDGCLHHVQAAIRRGNGLQCSICHQSGAATGCSMPRCKETFHYHCAMGDGVLSDGGAASSGCMLHVPTKTLYCGKHRQKFEQVFNPRPQRPPPP